jgi:3-deoxy-7-phosphoheptulonate synthase
MKLCDRESKPEGTVVNVRGVAIGGPAVVVMAGPCAVESLEQLLATARAVQASGASILRGGAFKPRTSPYSFQGLKEEGLKLLKWVSGETGLPIVTEVMDTRRVEQVCEYSDMLQVGSRHMHSYPLLEEVGRTDKPVLLKRGMSATLDEFLFAAEYVLKAGNEQVVLCERGIRTFEQSTRNTLDLNAVPVLKRLTHLPVIVDPSHGTGHWWMVPWMSRGAVAVDGAQSLKPDQFDAMMREVRAVAQAVGRTVDHPPPTRD